LKQTSFIDRLNKSMSGLLTAVYCQQVLHQPEA
jgi:hypothetical protein